MDISKELIRIAKYISALDKENGKAEKWDVYELDVWGNEEDGWDLNSWSKVFSVDVPKDASDDEWRNIVEAEFDKHYKDFGGLAKKAIRYEWNGEGHCTIVLDENDKPLWNIIRDGI